MSQKSSGREVRNWGKVGLKGRRWELEWTKKNRKVKKRRKRLVWRENRKKKERE